MKKPEMPADGWPWSKPGYRFSIGWPPGHEFTEVKGRSDADASARGTAARNAQLAKGVSGTIVGLTRASDLRTEVYIAAKSQADARIKAQQVDAKANAAKKKNMSHGG